MFDFVCPFDKIRFPGDSLAQKLAVISLCSRWRNHSLPRETKILPEYLRCQGYATHLVGKWQMGFCDWDLTPTRRGFETFYGSYGGNSDHFTHTPLVGGYDFRSVHKQSGTRTQKIRSSLLRIVQIIKDSPFYA